MYGNSFGKCSMGYVLCLFVEIPLPHDGRSDLSGKIDFLRDFELGVDVFFFSFFFFFVFFFSFPSLYNISLDS